MHLQCEFWPLQTRIRNAFIYRVTLFRVSRRLPTERDGTTEQRTSFACPFWSRARADRASIALMKWISEGIGEGDLRDSLIWAEGLVRERLAPRAPGAVGWRWERCRGRSLVHRFRDGEERVVVGHVRGTRRFRPCDWERHSIIKCI
jgi:hypothetical protein